MSIDAINLQANMFAASQLKPEIEGLVEKPDFDFLEAGVKGKIARSVLEYLQSSENSDAVRLRSNLEAAVKGLEARLDGYETTEDAKETGLKKIGYVHAYGHPVPFRKAAVYYHAGLKLVEVVRRVMDGKAEADEKAYGTFKLLKDRICTELDKYSKFYGESSPRILGGGAKELRLAGMTTLINMGEEDAKLVCEVVVSYVKPQVDKFKVMIVDLGDLLPKMRPYVTN